MSNEDWQGINFKDGNSTVNNPVFNFGTPRKNPNRRDFHNRQDLLTQIKNEVEGRLNQSLHNIDPINLQKVKQPHQVKRPWDREVKVGTQDSVLLPAEVKIVEVFQQSEIAGKLLILGEPGSGKTITLLELARQLITRTENSTEPIPVLFNLSEWKEDLTEKRIRQIWSFLFFWRTDYELTIQPQDPTIENWLLEQLREKYGVPLKIGQKLINERQIIPLLDGLDELKSERQERCVQALNQFLQSESRPLYLVACCRRKKYENYSTKLNLQGAICLQPLTNQQISDYIIHFGPQQLWQSLEKDTDLFELAKSPLLLSVMTLAYKEISIAEWQNLQTSEERRKYLFDAYIERMLKRDINSHWQENNKPTDQQTKLWLSNLAKILKRQAQTEFLLEKMQPNWLQDRKDNFLYYVVYALIISVLIIPAINFVILISFKKLLSHSLLQIVGIAFGIILTLLVALLFSSTISSAKKLTFSWRSLSESLSEILFWSLLFLLLQWLKKPSLFLFILSAIKTLVFLITYFSIKESEIGIEQIKIPNQGIWKSLSNAIIILILVSVFLSSLTLLGNKNPDLHNILVASSSYGLIFGLLFGGSACIKYFILRLILWKNGLIPWNYALFLDYATERMFLQRIGGRYRFIHDLLREHFTPSDVFSGGDELLEQERYEEAIASYDKILELKPNNQNAWHSRGICLRRLGRAEEAVDSYDKALKIKPNRDDIWTNRGIALERLKRYEEAVASYDKALKIKPNSADIWGSRGYALHTLERYEEAVASYDKALKIKPDSADIWNSRGICLRRVGRAEEAVASYDKALKIKPDSADIWDNRGYALHTLERYEEAIASYDKALKIKPDSYNAFYNKACLYAVQQQCDLAIENLQKAINLNSREYREMAKTDSDFDNIREDARFQALIQIESEE